jgi:hypothetical protein
MKSDRERAIEEEALCPGCLCEPCACPEDDPTYKCPRCRGTGHTMEGWDCEYCDGTGELEI